MKLGGQLLFSNLLKLGNSLIPSKFRSVPHKYNLDEPPLRAELYSADQMEQHGKKLALRHKISTHQYPDQLLKRLSDNEAVLAGSLNLLIAAVKEERHITPAEEWLVDNFYLIDQQIRLAKRHLPKNYSQQLPRLKNGQSSGLPRVYDIALEIISHGDGRVDPPSLSRFINAYQTIEYLQLGELWAIPIMLRLALIENLRRIAARIATNRIERDLADFWARQMLDIAGKDPKSLILVIADMARSKPPMSGSFVAELVRRLQGQSAALALSLPLTWIEQSLSESGLTITQLVHAETQQQAIEQVSISNSIASLRFLESMNWQNFVEQKSVVETTLNQDPSGTYKNMAFATRDRYRHLVEELAKKSVLSEMKLAQLAIKLAQEAMHSNGRDLRAAHVGYYLIDAGLPKLKKAAKISRLFYEILGISHFQFHLFIYLSSVGMITLFLNAVLLLNMSQATSFNVAGFLFIILIFANSQFAIAIVNWLTTLLINPESLPRMDFSEGIAPEYRSLVVIPSILASKEHIWALCEALEVRFLANQDTNLHFALLTDFKDAHEEIEKDDEQLLSLCKMRIEDLNKKYKTDYNDRFFLLHRPRLWNSIEQVWMGHERKRGKLADLNALLRGFKSSQFMLTVGNTKLLTEIKYVITLDTDTNLPRDEGKHLVGAMAHPLNQPLIDKAKRIVSTGHGILQPRVSTNLPGINRSPYAQLNSSEPGIDPYTRAVSDVYQDAFGEGSFIGKGIYDVDAFEEVLKDRFPDNSILSHDLLEGCYLRSGLISDAELYEEYPHSYIADTKRRLRWTRGDWQLLGWLFVSVQGFGSRREKNPLSLLSRWKIFDNLRRSLIPFALLVVLTLAWTVISPAWFWTFWVLVILFGPSLIISTCKLFWKPEQITFRQHYATTRAAAWQHACHEIFALTCLPFEAFTTLSTITVTLLRMLITRKGLLQWSAHAESENQYKSSIFGFYRRMFIAPAFSLIFAFYLLLEKSPSFIIACPFLVLWFSSPACAWWLSQPIKPRKPKLTGGQIVFLRTLARQTWAFFETFVTSDDNWLPPDNYQENRPIPIAHRTSPTNIGLSLLANLSAYDFGYISLRQLLLRTTNTITAMESLSRYKGHFYNWYDTQTLEQLAPSYVSTVDSGNLSGCLLTLDNGLSALLNQKILSAEIFNGLADTLKILQDSLDDKSLDKLSQFYEILGAAIAHPPATGREIKQILEHLANSAENLLQNFNSKSEAYPWVMALNNQCLDFNDEINALAPWLTLQNIPQDFVDFPNLEQVPTLIELAKFESLIQSAPNSKEKANNSTEEVVDTREELCRMLRQGCRQAKDRVNNINKLLQRIRELARFKYDFLFDETRHLLSIGYNVAEHRLDNSYYDLLASEARLSYFLGIAQGYLPKESWFALGRLLTTTSGEPLLLSWSGSMFEYLMPILFMPNYENTLLDETYKAVVKSQIEYVKTRGLPWGISESGYNVLDLRLNYQYRAFGVPELGLKRGLADDLVIAPYASVLALMVAPEESCTNLQRFAADGFLGKYGFYEAIDYTSSRLPRGQSYAVIRSFMAHHQGMSFLSLNHLLLDKLMPKRFDMDPAVKATTVLLQERIPRSEYFELRTNESDILRPEGSNEEIPARFFDTPHTAAPEIQLLSNGRYHVMMTNAGGGSSTWKDLAVTRWREDSTLDNWGTFCYVRDEEASEFWSIAYQPTHKRLQNYEAIFSPARVEYRNSNNGLDTHCEITVSPEDDIELHKIRITNKARGNRTISITSYAEVVLAPAISDALHPAFSNLFVQTEIIKERQAIICHRRPRSQNEQVPWMFHLMAVQEAKVKEISFESSRAEFIGRDRNVSDPQAMSSSAPLSGSSGSVLDPIVAVRYLLTIGPEESALINIVTGISETRQGCLDLVEKYQDCHLAERVFDLALTHSDVVLRQLNATEADAKIYCQLASSIIYANRNQRADAGIIIKNRRGQSGLWGYAISGDLPIVLLQIQDALNIDLARQVIQAHAYWRLKGLKVDLVIWNEDHAGYRQVLQDQILGLIASGAEANVIDKPGGIFLRSAEQIPNEDRILIQSVARIIIKDSEGTLAQQANRRVLADIGPSRLETTRNYAIESSGTPLASRSDLLYYNGCGGFTADGQEYVITNESAETTPAPWSNVLANPTFGTVVTQSGSAYTWRENAHEFRLTPWHNDPISDSCGEAIYIRDEDSGHYWSPTPYPVKSKLPYISRHGFGYSVFEHKENGISSELWVYVALDAPIKFSVLKIRNESTQLRRLSATGYTEWVLGDLRSKSAMHIVTELDPKSGALFAYNPYSMEFSEYVAFFDVDDVQRTVSGNRSEFLGRNGSIDKPAAMSSACLSGKLGAALDPCGAIQVPFELTPGQEKQIVFRLGAGYNTNDANAIVNRFRGAQAAHNALQSQFEYWKHTLGAIHIETPDKSMNMLVNGWLLYQTITGRLWARSGYYQSGGAFGFRDQLQDSMALIHSESHLLREHLLLFASRQFKEGDVQHWWHPPAGRGVRTKCSDDYLWLPLATSRYVLKTGDTGILEEQIGFLDGRPLNADEDSYYDLPLASEDIASLYDHCVRAIKLALKFGEHGLPLMRGGDWNDGMNLVGHKGKGESVWLAFFLYDVLQNFSKVALLRNDQSFAQYCKDVAEQLRSNIELNAWDGAWYRRAYFDDGTPLGSVEDTECRIDSISQSWSVLSGAASAERQNMAMAAVENQLVDKEYKLIKLLKPPFDQSKLEPGYIKGYVPGVRENGGQYTHGAIWTIMAFAALKNKQRTWDLWSIINPINHSKSLADIKTYKVEPYVTAADVYAVAPHTGRGGWTWYTGSAAWMYRLITESLLGLHLEVDKLYFKPCLPEHWTDFKVHYRYRETVYHINVLLNNTDISHTKILVDGVEQNNGVVNLVNDRQEHRIEVIIGSLNN